MARAFPPDVLVLDDDSLLHARLSRSRAGVEITHAKSYRLLGNTFAPAVVTPELVNEAALAEVLRRLRIETGKWDKASILLPDAWFRINIVDLQSFPDARDEQEQMVRWSLKRTLPIDPAGLRVAFEVISTTAGQVKVLVVSAVEKTLAAIEALFQIASVDVVLMEPIGLNLWNAITVREQQTTRDRIFFYVRETDFTTAVFRGAQPLFIRSRNLNADRTVQQEIRLSASYLRDTLRMESIENCYLAGNRVEAGVSSTIEDEFHTPVTTIALSDFIADSPALPGCETELAACTGVFT